MAKLTFIIRNDDGTETVQHHPPGTYIVGREAGCDVVIQALSISRKHCRLTVEENCVTVEDLKSSAGTTVGGQPVVGVKRFDLPVEIKISHVPLRIMAANRIKAPSAPAADSSGDLVGEVGLTLSAGNRRAPVLKGVDGRMKERLEMLYQLPLQFAAEKDVEHLFRLILHGVMQLVPGARRGALLLIEKETGKFQVKASMPSDTPSMSRTLIRRAIEEQEGFIWGNQARDHDDLSASMAEIRIRTGMFAPLVWDGETIGVLFVDNEETSDAFAGDDLQFLMSVAHYAASALANQMLQNEIEQNNETLEHLLANFSPKIRRRLLEKSREGRLQPGGEKSNVTILLSDLRGFTRTSASLDSQVVVDMLNDYFRVLGHEIFRHDGTIDKFIGDAILAVFGSPEPDADHALKAVLAAIEMQRQMSAVNARRAALGLPTCELGVGVYTGEVLHGFIGSEDRLEYTVIGDTVNKASRHCDGAMGGQIVLGSMTHEHVGGRIPSTAHVISTKHEGQLSAFLVDWTALEVIREAERAQAETAALEAAKAAEKTAVGLSIEVEGGVLEG